MNKLGALIKGEFIRLFKYKILFTAVAVTFLWCLIIGFTDSEMAIQLVPTLLYADAGMMSIIFLGASYYLEKQEGTMKTLFVAPVRLRDVLIAKVIGAFSLGLISMILLTITTYLFHHTMLPIVTILPTLVLIVVSHTAMGYVLTIYCKDFSSLIVFYGILVLVFLMPSIFYSFGMIPTSFQYLLLLSPFHAGQVMLSSMIAPISNVEWIVSIVYLLLIPTLLYPLVIMKRLQQDAIGG